MSALGRWTVPRHLLPSGDKLRWGRVNDQEPLPLIGFLSGHPMAMLGPPRMQGSACTASMRGWIWVTQLREIDGDRTALAESVLRDFESLDAAKQALDAALCDTFLGT